MINCMKQLELPVRGRGGRRPGAGPKFQNRGWVVHLRRPDFPARFPQHATLRVRRGGANLREEKRWRGRQRGVWGGGERVRGGVGGVFVRVAYLGVCRRGEDREGTVEWGRGGG